MCFAFPGRLLMGYKVLTLLGLKFSFPSLLQSAFVSSFLRESHPALQGQDNSNTRQRETVVLLNFIIVSCHDFTAKWVIFVLITSQLLESVIKWETQLSLKNKSSAFVGVEKDFENVVTWCELYPRGLRAKKQSSKLKKQNKTENKTFILLQFYHLTLLKNLIIFLVIALWFSATRTDNPADQKTTYSLERVLIRILCEHLCRF